MSQWPATRLTLLDRLLDRGDQEAWSEFVGLYGPVVFRFARRRLPQDEDAADVMQEVLGAVLQGKYQRPQGRFQKWLVTILLNKIRDFHAARSRRCEWSGSESVDERLREAPSRAEEEEWDREYRLRLFHAAAARVRERTNATHWDVFVRVALREQSGQEVADALGLSLTNVYAIKSRVIQAIKDEIQTFAEG